MINYITGKPRFNKINSDSNYSTYDQYRFTFADMTREATINVAQKIILDQRVYENGVSFVSKLFNEKQTQEAAVILLKDVLKDERFIFHSQIWAVDLLAWAVKQQGIINSTKTLFENVLKEEKVISETVNLFKYVTLKQESKDLLAQYYIDIFEREDIRKAAKLVISEGAYQGLSDPVTVQKFAEFIMKVINAESVRSGIMDAFVYKPIAETFKFW